MILDTAWIALGQPDHAVHAAAALEILEDIGDLEGTAGLLTFVGAFDYWQGRWGDAIERWERGRDLYVRTGNVVEGAFGTCNIGEVLILQGRYDEARPHVEHSLTVFRSAHNAIGMATALLNFGRMALRQDDIDGAIGFFQEAKGMTSDGNDAVIVDADTWIGECLLRQGHVERALDVIEGLGAASAQLAVPRSDRRSTGCAAALVALGRSRGRLAGARRKSERRWRSEGGLRHRAHAGDNCRARRPRGTATRSRS